ncbi:hypothetical protein FLA_5241 [Filimonas lacunae]|nr:hypothetical protein FLA_5241 [Filimonas lacunae]
MDMDAGNRTQHYFNIKEKAVYCMGKRPSLFMALFADTYYTGMV